MLRTAGYLLILLPTLIILISIFRKKDSFISLGTVFRNHFSMFKSCKGQGIVFYVFPIIISFGVMFLYKLSLNFCENINIVTSIILSMLFAICSIIGTKDYSSFSTNRSIGIKTENDMEAILNAKAEKLRQDRIKNVAKETFDAIVVTTFVALVLIFICLAALAVDIFSKSIIVLSIMSVIVYYLLGVTILNLLLIIKRMEKLFIAML